MTTEWVVTTAAERLSLDPQNRGEITFTVTNPGRRPDRAIFDLVADDAANLSWFTVDEPQRVVAPGASVSFLVRVAVPAGTAAGPHTLQGRVYSADSPPEESSRLSGRVVFDIPAAPQPKRRPWWPYAVAAALVLVVLAVVGWLVLRPKAAPPQAATPTASASPSASGPATLDYEAENLNRSATANVIIQPSCCGVTFSNNAQVFLTANDAGQALGLTFTVPAEGTYTFASVRTRSFDYGNTSDAIDNRPIGDVFFGFNSTPVLTDWITEGQVHLTPGRHVLTVTVVGRSAASRNFYAGIDRIRLVREGNR